MRLSVRTSVSINFSGPRRLGGHSGETSSASLIVQAGRFIPYTAPSTGARAHAGGYAAHFVEVHVDPELCSVRVARVISAIDGGRILNPNTARNQIIGGIAMGIGMALLEETVLDGTGRLATTSLAEYVVAANADVSDVDVLFVGEPDSMTPLGTKGTRRARGSARCRSQSRNCSDARHPQQFAAAAIA